MKHKQSKVVPVTLLAALMLSANAVQAGEMLQLKTGGVRLMESAQSALSFAQRLSGQRFYVIQFKSRITEEAKDQLRARGIDVKNYLPDDALVVKADLADLALAWSTISDVRAIVPFAREWKLAPETALMGNDLIEKNELFWVRTLGEEETADVTRDLSALPGVEVYRASGRSVVIGTLPSHLDEVSAVEGIEWVQAMPIVQTFDLQMSATDVVPMDTTPALTGYESGTKLMNMDAAWNRGFKGAGQIAAEADTGVDSGNLSTLHADLKTQVKKGYPMGMFNTSWNDPQGHGTHVAGSVVGTGAQSGGEIQGAGHGAQLIAEGMWSSITNNLMVETDFNKLMGTPYKDGARIHTNSWGSPMNLGAYENMAASADDITWKYPDLLVLFAAGNSGQDGNADGRIDEGSVSSPGTAKNVLTVGASENLLSEGGIQKQLGELRDGNKKWGVEPLKSDTLSNNPEGLAAFSSRGPTKDGRLKPEIVAPGTNIVSTRSKDPNATQLWGAYNEHYLYAGGTSMATPLTAGAATVMREFLVKRRGLAEPSSAVLKASLVHFAKDLFPGQYGRGSTQELLKVRPNVHEGYGRVDMDAATAMGNETQIVDNKVGVGLTEEQVATVSLVSGEGLRVTLVYTDAPAAANAAKALVNDIDLSVVGPAGTVTPADRKNNSEMVELSNLAGGEYRVRIKGVNIPQGKNGKQPFAVLVTRISDRN